MKEITQIFKNRENVIRKNRLVTDSLFSLVPPNKFFKSKKVEKNKRIKIPRVLLDFFSRCDGFTLDWKAIIDNKTVTGHSSILGGNLFFEKKVNAFEQGGVYAKFWSQCTLTSRQKELEKFFILDDIGYANYVLFELDENTDQPHLFLYLHFDRIYELTLSFEEYILKTIEYGGIYLWQRYFCKGYEISPFELEDNCAEYMKILFPETDSFPSLLSFNLPKISGNKDYRSLFSQIIDEFAKRRKVKKEELSLNFGAPIGALVKAQETLQKKLPEDFVCFFSELNGLTFEWSKDSHHGCININPIEVILGGSDGALKKEWYQSMDFFGTVWHDEESDKAEQYKKLRPLEIWFGTNAYSALDFESENLDIFLHDEDGEFYKMPISFPSYIEALLLFLGLDNWPILLISGTSSLSGNVLIQDIVNEIFPEVNINNKIDELTR